MKLIFLDQAPASSGGQNEKVLPAYMPYNQREPCMKAGSFF